MDSVSSALPRIAVDDKSGIYAVWMDERNGNKKDDVYFSRNETLTSLKSRTPAQPVKYSLLQNYPNPFNPSTVIAYRLPHPGFVSLSIYNRLGQKVCTAVNQKQKAGRHSVTFNASRLASGVYFYRLSTGSGLARVRKMILLH